MQHDAVRDGAFDVPISLFADLLGEFDPRAVCLVVTSVDDAGNRGMGYTLCGPCHIRLEGPDADPYEELPPQPRWTDDDRYIEGNCDPVPPPPP